MAHAWDREIMPLPVAACGTIFISQDAVILAIAGLTFLVVLQWMLHKVR